MKYLKFMVLGFVLGLALQFLHLFIEIKQYHGVILTISICALVGWFMGEGIDKL